MRALAILVALVACGGKQQTGTGAGSGSDLTNTGTGSGSATPVKDTRTALEVKRDEACKAIAPKLTECAVEDAKADLAAGKVKKADFDRDTAPEVLHKHTDLFIEKCTDWRDISSRQVRVLEVCFKSESTCGPLRACLANLDAQK